MRIAVSGAAGCAAYVEGEDLHFIHVAGSEGWKTAAIAEMRHVFLGAEDVIELEVADRHEAETHAKRRASITHALQLLELIFATKLADVARMSESFLETWLKDKSVRPDIEKYCFATLLPKDIDTKVVLARIETKIAWALIAEIVERQPRIAAVDRILDRHLEGVAPDLEERRALKAEFIKSGLFQALVRDHNVGPSSGNNSRLIMLANQMAKELKPLSDSKPNPEREYRRIRESDESSIWQYVVAAVGILSLPLALWDAYRLASNVFWSGQSETAGLIVAVAVVGFGILAFINRNR